VTFKDRLAAAKTAKPRFRDVSVVLDSDVAEQIATLEAERDEAAAKHAEDARFGMVDPSVELGDKIDKLRESAVDETDVLRFYKMDGLAWAALIAEHPPRPNVLLDLRYGFNLHAVVPNVAPQTGRVVDGDEELTLTREEWKDLLSILSGYEVERIADAVFTLNEWDPQQAVERAKKASTRRADSAQKSS
jgi:hypothetical protein